MHFEKAAILFNIGAVLTQAALAADRTSDAGLKEAARKLQEAAGAFGALRDGPALKVEAPRPVDVGPECAAMLEKLCLAQAQELTFEKARLDGKAPAILARSGGLTVTGCDFMDLGKAQITLEPEVEAALIYGNRLREKQLITNRAGSCAQIGMNVVSRK